jgi:hypothetical protein
MDTLQHAFQPVAPAYVLEICWMHKLAGDEAKARAVYQDAVLRSVPLPAMP